MDFGISHMLSTTTQYAETTTSGEIGSIPWMAPELLNPADTCIHTLASDIWAFGMVVFVSSTFFPQPNLFTFLGYEKETLTKKYPFEDRGKKNNAQIIMLILSGILPKNPQKHARLSSTDYLWDLCSESVCWNMDPKLRPTIAVIQAHLYTKGREPPRNDLEPFVNTTRVHYTGSTNSEMFSPGLAYPRMRFSFSRRASHGTTANSNRSYHINSTSLVFPGQ